MANDLHSHWVSDSISVDEDMVGKVAVVVVSESLESTFKVLLEYSWADDFLAFLPLRTGLGIVFAHVLIICRTESNDTLFALVTNIDTDKHSLFGDLRAKIQTPQITT